MIERTYHEIGFAPQAKAHILDNGNSDLSAPNASLQQFFEQQTRGQHLSSELVRPYQCLVQGCMLAVCITQSDKILLCNPPFAALFGYEPRELVGKDITCLLPDDLHWKMAATDPVPSTATVETLEREVRGTTKNGNTIWIRESIARLRSNGDDTLVRSLTDITEHKRLEEHLQESEREIQALSEQLIAVQEAERKRIASELHDGIGQSLSAIKFATESIVLNLRSEISPAYNERLAQIVERLKAAIEEVRGISMALRPSILDDLGIEATIGWFTREFQETYPSINVIKNVEVEEEGMDANFKTVVFRILQETLNNVAKHASATEVRVGLTEIANDIVLRIHDNGIGLVDLNERRSGRRFGICSMKERAKLSGGSLTVRSAPGKGTTVEAVWRRRLKSTT